jgi:hypothetical protein
LAYCLSLQAQEVPQAEANIEKELPIPSAVFIPPPPPKKKFCKAVFLLTVYLVHKF